MSPIFSAVLDRILFMLAGNDNIHESLDEFEFGQILSGTTELAALEHLKKSMLPLFLVSQLWLYLGNSQVSVYRTIGPLVFAYAKKRFSRDAAYILYSQYLPMADLSCQLLVKGCALRTG